MSAISNTLCLELSLSRTISSVPSAFPISSLRNPSGISNPAISNFHYLELFFGPFSYFIPLSRTFLLIEHSFFNFKNLDVSSLLFPCYFCMEKLFFIYYLDYFLKHINPISTGGADSAPPPLPNFFK